MRHQLTTSRSGACHKECHYDREPAGPVTMRIPNYDPAQLRPRAAPAETAAMNRNTPAILGGSAIRPEGPPDWPFPDPDVAARVQGALADGSWGKYHGPHVPELAELLAAYHDCAHVALCSSGTAALELALRGLGVGRPDEVILAAYDFKGNFHDVLAVGAVPVLVDVLPGNWNIDPARIPAAV